MFWRSILRRAVPPASQHVVGSHQARAGLPHSTTTTGKLRDRARFVASTLLWMPVVIMFNEIVAEVTWINGASMYPYFNADKDSTTRNDVVLNYKFKAQEGLKRGMIVTFWNPTNPESTAVKRIVGLEGDVVRTRSPWPEPAAKVPEFHVWVQGDGSARDNLDSNTYGPVPVGLITGKVTHILYPFAKAGRVRWWEHNVEKTKTPRP